MKPTSKQRQSELINELQRSIDHPHVQMIVELVTMMFEAEKHALIDGSGDELFRTQGKAQALGQLVTMITRPIMAIKPPQQTGE